MTSKLNPVYLLVVLVLGACAPRPVPSDRSEGVGGAATTTSIKDISAYRPSFPAPEPLPKGPPAVVTPTNHVNDKVRVLMDSVASANKNIKFAQGYRIMAYNGTNRQVAMDTRRAIIQRVPQQKDYLVFQQPSYRLKIGDYFTRLEAQQTLQQLRDILPNALIIPDQIQVR